MSTVETHLAWCSPEHCSRTDEGVRVHQQAPTHWDGGCVVPLRFETARRLRDQLTTHLDAVQ